MKKLILLLFIFLPGILLAQRTILWKVTDEKSSHTSYLLGTYHLLNQVFVDSFPIIREKLNQCELVITEVEKDSGRIAGFYNNRESSYEINQILKKGDIDLVNDILKYSTAKNLYKFTSGELFSKLSNYYEAYAIGIPADKIFIDAYIQLMAKENHKRQLFLESDSLQIELLKKATEPLDWKYFKANITELLKKYRNPMAPANSSYNNFKNLNINYSFSKKCPEGILLKNRNNDWLIKINTLFREQNCFMAVGQTHLDYDCGLISQLRQLGFSVEPLLMQ